MHVGCFVNTPAHAHLYRELVSALQRTDDEVTVFARDDGPTVDILDYHDIPYRVYGQRGHGQLGLIRGLPTQLRRITTLVTEHPPDLVFGMGVYSTVAATVAGCSSITVMDSEPFALKHRLSSPLVDACLTPRSFTRDLGPNHFVFDGFKECAYLHPARFDPDPTIHDAIGVTQGDPYVLLRFNAFGGYHDVGQHGFDPDQKRNLIEQLSQDAHVLVSDENADNSYDTLPADPIAVHPARIHDVIAGAELLIADTQTMVTEAALLGTPAIRSNSFVGDDDMGNFTRLADAGLVWNVTDVSAVLRQARNVFESDEFEDWDRRHEAFTSDLCDLTGTLLDIIDACRDGRPVRSAVYHSPDLEPWRTRVSTTPARSVITRD